ncbi:MAG: YceI family protein [Deltaproteobacteria bacterium]|nr:MAG: YceI family protein [Deltaproteobacteria bacterium]
MKRFSRLILAVLLVAAPTLAGAATWRIDPDHAFVEFKVKHLMVSNVKGTFTKVDGTIEADEADLANSKVNVTIDTASIDTNIVKRDEHLRSADFFDVAKYPTMTFVSKRVLVDSGRVTKVIGDLTIRGTTREVTLDVGEFTPAIKDPWGLMRRGATATAVIDRKDFGLTWNKLLEAGGVAVGDEVRISLDIEMIRK